MKSENAKRFFFSLFVCVATVSNMATAQDDVFRHVQLHPDISLDVPSHWAEWSPDGRKNLIAAAEALADESGADPADGKKQTLLALNATPSPTGAMIRVSTVAPAYFTTDEILSLTPSELEEIGDAMFTSMRQLQGVGGPEILGFEQVRIESVGSLPALTASYVRSSAFGPSPWHVTQYRIPLSEHLVELTLSYRQSDAIIWRPILERVKNSVILVDSMQPNEERVRQEMSSGAATSRPKGPGPNALVAFFAILFLLGGSYLKKKFASNRKTSGGET